MKAIVWIDEEVGGFDRVTRKLKALGVKLTPQLDAGTALTWHYSSVVLGTLADSTAVLVVDMMLAAGDDGVNFSWSSTSGYMLTGLELLKLLEKGDCLSLYKKVVIYTALKDARYLDAVKLWVEGKNRMNGVRRAGPAYEIRPKGEYDHDKMLAALLNDLGLKED